MRLQRDDVESFYHLRGTALEHDCCAGLACFVARHRGAKQWEAALPGEARVYCLGKCYAAPARAEDAALPHIAVHARQGVVLGRLASGGAASLDRYVASGGYEALRKSLAASPADLIAELEASQLRGLYP